MVAVSFKDLKFHPSKFVKKLDEIPKVALPPSFSRRKALALVDRGLIGQFMGIWPLSKMDAFWLKKN
jgi:hypothetical protein